MPSKLLILNMDFRVPWKQNRICALGQFISDQPQLPNMTLSQFLPHDMSAGWPLVSTFPLGVSVLP